MWTVTRRLRAAYRKSKVLPFNGQSKIIIMSDCHRGQGDARDNLLSNQNVYFGALEYYYENGFTYIELGDGDELWENRSMDPIVQTHGNIFWLLSKFYQEKRFHMIYGNHDVVKKRKMFLQKYLSQYFCEVSCCNKPLFPKMEIPEALILENSEDRQKIFCVHGHQGDTLNDRLWPFARFLVRYLWGPLEMVGFRAPTGAGRVRKKKDKLEQRLAHFANTNQQILIAGHTHRPVFPSPGDGFYFNDGSCVHPRCITGIEIQNNQIALIKWAVNIRADRSLFIDRQVLEGPIRLQDISISKSSIQSESTPHGIHIN